MVTRGGRIFAPQIFTCLFCSRKTAHLLCAKPAIGQLLLRQKPSQGSIPPYVVMNTKKEKPSGWMVFFLVTRGGIEPPLPP